MPSRPGRHTSALAVAILATCLATAGLAHAQPQPGQPPQPPPPPPGYEPAPAQPTPPPPYYGQPAYGQPAYGQPPYGQPPYYGQPVMLGPREIDDYDEGDPIPPGYHPETHIRRGMVIGGLVTFGSLYLLTAATASAVDDSRYNALYAPAVGPFITIGTANSSGSGTFVLVIDGIAQSAGLAMGILGFILDRKMLVRNDVGSRELYVAPVVTRGFAGAGAVGRF